jgi:CheY-like chemotaxis protein
MRQILLKILSNAVKFTERGEIDLSVVRSASALDNVVITVRDTGIGFDPAKAERLFERFEQADGSLTRPFEGAGLGLAICKEVIQLLGGSIFAEGRPGEGATFTIELPLPKIETEGVQREPMEDSDGPMRILSAEDHPINRQLIEYILTTAGVSLVSVENGAQAVEAFKAEPFDAVLMDMQMPVMDGLTATREIRAFEASVGRPPTPVVMVTAHGLPEHIRTSLAAGADRHVTKPFVAADLLTVLVELAHAADLAKAS